jgi:hypothetical protein
MTTRPPVRSLAARKQDTLRRLEQDIDVWVATAALDGTPYLMPLSFAWNGTTLLLATFVNNPVARNLRANPQLQLTFGHTRDVVHMTATSEIVEVSVEEGDRFAEKAGFDPRPLGNYPFFRVTPTKIQAWRESDELNGRVLMESGAWLI